MELPGKVEKYTAKHVDEITDRIIALRVRWLRHVETQLASQQVALSLDRQAQPEAAEYSFTSFSEPARMFLRSRI